MLLSANLSVQVCRVRQPASRTAFLLSQRTLRTSAMMILPCLSQSLASKLDGRCCRISSVTMIRFLFASWRRSLRAPMIPDTLALTASFLVLATCLSSSSAALLVFQLVSPSLSKTPEGSCESTASRAASSSTSTTTSRAPAPFLEGVFLGEAGVMPLFARRSATVASMFAITVGLTSPRYDLFSNPLQAMTMASTFVAASLMFGLLCPR
mmetsp:Transcript_9571/g.33025  ORF Transcript_9571/g.33025 Transcript_9571/m.33025 type:complete len:210 (-) Transcript_9571:2180-2809(-)